MNYECHITIPREHAARGEQIAKDLHWKFSQIDGDPVLGKKTFAYLTTHDKDCVRIHMWMKDASRILTDMGIPVIREKIELIIYDTKAR